MIGLPRALMTYRLGAKWRAFFEELGREERVSEPSDRGVFERGQALSVDECCLASTLFLGHVDALAGEVDAVFVPSLSSSDALHTYCTKFQALPDLARSAFALAGREVRVLDALLAEGAAEKDERAFEDELGMEVLADADGHLMGAFGAALLAADAPESRRRPFAWDVDDFEFRTREVVCGRCANHCEVVCVYRDDELIDSWGNRCDRGAVRPRARA